MIKNLTKIDKFEENRENGKKCQLGFYDMISDDKENI